MLKEYIINLMDVNQEEMGRYVEAGISDGTGMDCKSAEGK